MHRYEHGSELCTETILLIATDQKDTRAYAISLDLNKQAKTCQYNFDPLKPHFYIVETGVYRGIHYFSYFCSKT